ncbi:MAG: CDP-alcohol phosphatidyltransferase family protein [Candidatus Micrarchaeia archaeon]|jgi:CDP-diacylglycerol--serine O-phosphatidyltransferase
MSLFQDFSLFEAKDLFSLANAACGVAGAALALGGNALAFSYVFGCIALDWADGRLARAGGRSGTALGKELDSLADCISFACVPALFCFLAAPSAAALAGGTAFVLAGVVRLALFNVQQEKNVFWGLPSPAAAVALVAASVLAPAWAWLASLALAFLMVAGFKFRKPAL